MEKMDISWHQRLSSFNKVLSQLSKFIEKGELNELEEQGLIKAFEYTYELAWNTFHNFRTYKLASSQNAYQTGEGRTYFKRS